MTNHTLSAYPNEYGRRLFSDPGFRRSEIAKLNSRNDRPPVAKDGMGAQGITIVMPTFKGADRIRAALDSVAIQSIDPSLIEIIVILNGPLDGTAKILEIFRSEFPEISVRWLLSPEPGAGAARNLGISAARRTHITFLDDDDLLEPNCLEAMWLARSADDRTIVLCPILDVEEGATLAAPSALYTRIVALSRQAEGAAASSVPWALGFNACKLVALSTIGDRRFPGSLSSGEDVVFWAGLLSEPDLKIRAIDHNDNAYRRQLRGASISRRTMGIEFAVLERLQAINALRQIEPAGAPESAAIDSLIRSQAQFVSQYVSENPHEHDKVATLIEESAITDFPWAVLNKGRAKDLAFLYCFSPFSDTSGIVAARRLAQRRRIVDVVSNDMTGVRRKDTDASALAGRWIDSTTLVQTPPSFAHWPSISEYAELAVARAMRDDVTKKYEHLYSRAMWVGSHVAALLYKARNPRIRWTAEFSDPMRFDAAGVPREGSVADDSVLREICASVPARFMSIRSMTNLFEFVEEATFALADEVVFTNQNQRSITRAGLVTSGLADRLDKVGIVDPHPVPAAYGYILRESEYKLPPGVINIGYFGAFYENRGIDDVLVAMQNSSQVTRSRVRLHVFCNSPAALEKRSQALGIGANVQVQGYLSYLEFLSLSTQFDVLVVNDVTRPPSMTVNPFLPSKLADYRGSGTKIFGITESGSPLSEVQLDYRAPVGDSHAIMMVLSKIAME